MINSKGIRISLLLMIVVFLSSCKGINEIKFNGVDNVVLNGIENNKIIFTADIGIINPSSVGFKVKEVNLKTSVEGIYIGTLKITDIIKIKAKSDTIYKTGFELEMANFITGATTLYSLSRKKNVTVEMQGYVTARSFIAFKKVDISEKQLIEVPSFSR